MKNRLNKSIKIIGNSFTLFVMYIYEYNLIRIYQDINKKIKSAPNLFKNASIVVNIKFLSVDINWIKLKYIIVSTGLKIIGVSGCKDKKLKSKIEKTNIPILYQHEKINNESVLKKKILNKSKIIYSQIRSGQKIYSYNSDLIIINNVNPGAELIASGNIHVYGIMRGKALAGALGDIKCQIFCSNFHAELISIAGKYLSLEKISNIYYGKAIRSFFQNDILQIKKIKY